MAFLIPYTRPQFAQMMVQEYDSVAGIPADTGEYSSLTAIFNAASLPAAVLEQQVFYVNAIARLATIPPNPSDSTLPNPDVDSFCAPFGVPRNQATPSTGQVLFYLSAPSSQPIPIPAVVAGSTGGVIAQTTSGTTFQVIIDPTNSNYNAAQQAYIIPAGQLSVSCTVQCTSPGTIGNVAAGQITICSSGPGTIGVAGIAYTNNPAAFTNAGAVESDMAYKTRFTLAMSTGTVGTSNAVAAAVLNVALGLTCSIGDAISPSGGSAPGTFTVVVNYANTPSLPPSSLLTAVTAALPAVRPIGITGQVVQPTLVPANIVANVRVLAGYSQTAVVAACTAAYNALANGVGLDIAGAPTALTLSSVFATLAMVPGVREITSLTLNGAFADVPAAFAHQVVAGTVSFTPYS